MKTGIRTTEFWLTAVANIAGALITLLAGYGLLTNEQGELWLVLVQAVAMAIIPLALAYINGQYIKSRTEVKTQIDYQVNVAQLHGDIEGVGDEHQ